MTRHALLVVCVAVAGCGWGSDDAPDRSGSATDSTQTASGPGPNAPSPSADSSAEASKGFFGTVTDFLLSNPRLDAEDEASAECASGPDYSGRSLPYHTLPIDNGNDFNTTNEAFTTSTPEAQTPYVAYATWDPCSIFLGMTGSAVGAGDCEGDDCAVIDRGESPYTYWLVYLDTDPQGSAGSQWPKEIGPTPDRLPIRADYLLEIRLDGVTTQTGDGYTYQGNAQLYGRTSDWRIGLEESWQPQGRDALTIGDNSSSNFIEVAIDRKALGDPCAVEMLGWVVDTRADTSFAHWPPPRNFPDSASRAQPTSGLAARRAAPDSARADSARRPPQRPTSPSSARGDTARRSASGTAGRRDTLALDVYGFMLMAGQQPNASGNLNRTDFSLVADGCTEPSRPRE